MAIYVSGGGAGTGALTSMSANSAAATSLFTTPNVDNTLYLITVQTRVDEPILEGDWETYKCNATYVDVTAGSWGGLVTNNDYGYNQTWKVGPNAAVKIACANASSTAGAGVYTYQYVSIIVDNN